MTILHGPARLTALMSFVEDMRAQEFIWGYLDCNTFALLWLDRLAGTNEHGKIVGHYDSEDTAREFAAGYGKTIEDVLAENGAVEVPGGRAFAQPGDFLLVEDPGEPWYRCHICVGGDFVSIWPERGLQHYRLRHLPADTRVLRLEATCPR